MKKAVSSAIVVLLVFNAFTIVNLPYCLAAEYKVEAISIETGRMINGVWKSNYYFYHNEIMSAKVTVRNNEATTEMATVHVTGFDYLNQPFNHYMENITLNAGETKTLYNPIYIPKWAISGNNCRVTVTIKVLPEGTYCPEKNANFYLLPKTACYLTILTLTTDEVQVSNIGVWIDGEGYYSAVTVPLMPGTHVLKTQTVYGTREIGMYYKYVFEHWDDESTTNPRIINIPENTNKTVLIYYTKYSPRFQPI